MYVALLRAVNVGGHGMVAMADLRAAIGALGFRDVRSVLQSGNVVFGGGRRSAAAIERLLENEITSRLGVRADCFVRTAREWAALVAANPFVGEARRDPRRVILMCLKSAPSPTAVRALQKAIRGPEVVRATERQLYVVYPDGMGRSQLTGALIERTLATRGTARNWNTVLKLAAMLESSSE